MDPGSEGLSRSILAPSSGPNPGLPALVSYNGFESPFGYLLDDQFTLEVLDRAVIVLPYKRLTVHTDSR